jgi:prepilin-type N-terminal cleavage/methylation domain-containing protein
VARVTRQHAAAEGRHGPEPRAEHRCEAGLTLVELLITLVIMGMVSVTMSATVMATVVHSSTTRDISILDTELRRFADKVRALPYHSCATADVYDDLLAADVAALADRGITAGVTDVLLWQEDPDEPLDVSTFVRRDEVATCTSDNEDDDLQRVTVTVEMPTAPVRSVVVSKRYFP